MIPPELPESVRQRRVILFAGSGLSRAVNLPSWGQLIAHMARELGYDPAILMGSRPGPFDFMALAEFYRLQTGSLTALQRWMQENWSVPKDVIRSSRPHRLIADLKFPLIYTTNYDHVIEEAFRLHGVGYHKIVHVHEIALAQDGVTQVVKFHGDYDDAPSMVVTESDYYTRLAFESPLDIKLRADAIGRSLLFIGYSLSDINIRLLLHRLQEMWRRSPDGTARPRSFIFMLRPDPVQERVLREWGVTSIVVDVDDPATALEAFLDRLHQAVSSTLDAMESVQKGPQ